MYASVSGWIRLDHELRSAVEEVIERHGDGFYSGGWGFPSAPFNWSLHVFYGGEIRESELPWLREQVSQLAALPAVDADGDRPRGLFLITDERGEAAWWEVRDETVGTRAAPDFSWIAE